MSNENVKRILKESPIILNVGGNCIAQIKTGEEGEVHTEPFTIDDMQAYLVKQMRWGETKDSDDDYDDEMEGVPKVPPKEVSKEIVLNPPPLIPIVNSIITTPVFASSAKLLLSVGLHEDERIWHHKDKNLCLPSVNDEPAKDEIFRSVSLLEEMLCDFPFEAESDKAHAIAALILPFLRPMIKGNTPLHSFEAPMPGSGKGLLTDCLGIIVTGREPDTLVYSEQPEEFRKRLTAQLLKGMSILLLDNVPENRTLDSPDLAAALTSTVWTDRLLGQSKMVTAQNRCLWALTGNNPTFSRELMRRVIRIRVNPQTDKPWMRTEFKHPDLKKWVRDNRGNLVHAILTIIQGWIAAGQPRSEKRLGSFEDWSSVVGGVLEFAGIDGFMQNLNEMYESADTEGEEWRDFFNFVLSLPTGPMNTSGIVGDKAEELFRQALIDRNNITVKAAEKLCSAEGLLTNIMGSFGGRSRSIRLGRAFKRIRDRVYSGHKLVTIKDDKKHGRVYALVPADSTP